MGKLKYSAMFGEAQKKVYLPSECDHEENKLEIENGRKNLLMIFQITRKPNQTDEENGISRNNSKLNEMLSNGHRNHRERSSKKQPKERGRETPKKNDYEQTLRKSTDEQNKASTPEEKKPSNKTYKIRRIWNT